MTSQTHVRQRRAWPWIVGGVLVIVVGAVVVAGATFLAAGETTEETTYDVSGVERIDTQADVGNVEIAAEDRADISVTTVARSSFGSDPQVTVRLADGVLSLEAQCRLFLFGSCSVSYRVLVPTDHEFAAEVQTTAGNIAVTGHIGVEADLQTTTGDVLFVADVPPAMLAIQTTAGNITVRVPDVDYQIEAQATLGNVNIDLNDAPAADGRIVVATTIGNIDLGPN